jgi:hypothetical protein
MFRLTAGTPFVCFLLTRGNLTVTINRREFMKATTLSVAALSVPAIASRAFAASGPLIFAAFCLHLCDDRCLHLAAKCSSANSPALNGT